MPEARRYYYNFAIIYRPLHMCNEVRTCTSDDSDASDETYLYIRIPKYDENYIMKYYDEATGRWYLDSEMTQEWFPPTE